MDYYTEGNLAASLASFREALRLEPNNHSARSAVRRLERESAIRPDAAGFRRLERIAHRAEDGLIDRFFLISLPRWFYFERTFGDGLRDAGTMAAVNARVVQLLGERRVAFARNRPFAKDRLLRELLRRAPAAAGAFEEV